MRSLVVVAALLFAPQLALAQPRPFVPGVRVTVAPPPLRFETPPPAPSPRHQWVAGYWAWRGGAHVWIPGAWVTPPAYGYVWEPARWENVNGAWQYYEGHWRNGENVDPNVAYQPPPPPVNEVQVPQAPPVAIEEVRPVAPFPGAVWIPGYWHWEYGRHAWVAGRWSARPGGFEWHEHRWEKGPQGNWSSHPGHWYHR